MLPQPAAPDNHTDCHTSRSEHDRARLPPLRQLVPTQNRCERPFARIPIDHRPVRYKYDIIIISNDSEGNMVETGAPALNRSRETRANTQSGYLMLFIWLLLLGLATCAGIHNANAELMAAWKWIVVTASAIVEIGRAE